MICPKRTAELVKIHLAPFKDKDPAWEIGVSNIAGRGIFATRDIKQGEIIFKDAPLLIGPAARKEDTLNSCSNCFKMLPDTKFMCRQGCGLPICSLCGKKKQHKSDCDLYKSWQPCEPDVANSVVIRLLCVARAVNLTKDQRDLIYCLQANLDNNHRTEVRNGAKCFKNFPTDKKFIEIMNRTVAVLRTNGFDETAERTNDNQEFFYRALFPLFAVMNHDCVPNSYYIFEDKTNNMIVKASVDIAAGTEITTTYTKLFTTNITRHLFLKIKKTFTCKCARCTDPTEKQSFVSAAYCRDSNCPGFSVPGITGMPQPDWHCLVCKQKSTHAQMIKYQDFAAGALKSKIDSHSLKNLIDYITNKSNSFIPDANIVVIDAKLLVIRRLKEGHEDCTPEEANRAMAKYCQDLLYIMERLELGECVMRTYLETHMKAAKQFLAENFPEPEAEEN